MTLQERHKIYKILLPFIWLVKQTKKLSALSCRLVQLTGKSKYPIHPKHLIANRKNWYLKDLGKRDVVLDLGCHNGQHSIEAALKSKRMVAVDYDKKQLEIARQSALEREVENIRFLKLNLERKLPFKNRYFDKILFLDVLEHLYKRDQILDELRRILKTQGVIFISIPHKNTAWKKIQRLAGLNSYADPDHKIEYSFKGIKKVLKDHKFEVLEIKPIVYDTPWAGLIDLIGGISLSFYQKLINWKQKKLKTDLKQTTGFRIKVKKLNRTK